VNSVGSVTLKNVKKAYGDTVALHDMSLHIEEGEFFSLLGPSGCGKSTLLNIVAGLLEHDEGSISIDDRDVGLLAPRDRGIAMVFQDYALYPHMTVFENLSFPLKARRGMSRKQIKEKVEEVLDILSIDEMAGRLPRELSGGQRQRVAVGRALVREPKVFLMDEPLSNLDARLRVQMRRELQLLHKRLKPTIIYVTHDQTEAMSVSDRIAVLSEGRLQQVGPPKEVYDHPARRFVANFLGLIPMTQIEGSLQRDEAGLHLLSGGLRYRLPRVYQEACASLSDGYRVCLGIHPEHVHVSRDPQVGSMPGRVELCDQLGSDQYLLIDVDGSTVVGRVSPDFATQAGAPMHVSFDEDRVHLFDEVSGENLLFLEQEGGGFEHGGASDLRQDSLTDYASNGR
jgi:ABC-type sugar transport system ATPase subunit